MSNTVNIALIGCGGMMGAHVDGFRRLWEKDVRNFRIIAACDVYEDRAVETAKKVADWQGIEPVVYSDPEVLLKSEKSLDAVDISVLHRLHHSVALPFIEAGKHVTIEKPLAMTMRTGKMMLDAVEKAGVVFQVAENYRRSPQERAFNWVIKSGRIGKLRQIYWIDVGERLWYWGWRDHVEEAGGGWSMDGGVHYADLFRYHVGEVDRLYAISKAYHPVRYGKHETMEDPIPATVEDCTMAVLTFENGVTGTWTSTMSAPGASFSRRAIYGEYGSLMWGEGLQTRTEKLTTDELVDDYMAQLSESDREKLFPRGITDTVATELNEFVEAILNGMPVEITGLEGYKDEAISLALYESEALGEPVSIKDIENLKIENYQDRFNTALGIK